MKTTMLSMFFYVFSHDTSKNVKSRVFDFEKRKKRILLHRVNANCKNTLMQVITRLSVRAALSVALRPSVRLSRASDFLEIGQP